MALIKISGVATAISGKLGGSILGTSPNGSYIKQNSWSQQPNSPRQTIQRNLVGQVTQLWRTLSSGQKNDWQAETINYPYTNRVGDVVEYTAFQLFNKLNLNLQVQGVASNIDSPPFVPVVNPDYQIGQNPANQLTGSYTTGVFGTAIAIYCAPPQSSNLSPAISTYRLITTFTISTAIDTFGLNAQYQSVFGNIPGGTNIWSYIKTTAVVSGNTTETSNPDFVLYF